MLDLKVLNEICMLINNHFDTGKSVYGDFDIENGDIIGLPEDFKNNAHVWISGSNSNDGAYCVGNGGLTDEHFTGTITVMQLPRDFQNIVEDVADWKTTNAEALSGVFQSESFGGYARSYDVSGAKSTVTGVFGSRLSRYRKIV